MNTDKATRALRWIIGVPMIVGMFLGCATSPRGANSEVGPGREGGAKGVKASLPASGEEDVGFVSLFNGQNLDGWQGSDFSVADGVMACHGHHGGGLTYTNAEFTNFVLRFEFRLSPGANNGLNVRADGEIWNELQILDDVHPTFTNIHPYQAHGSIYGLVPAKRGFLKPAGQWNDQEVMADGPHIKVTLNGTVIVNADLRTLDLDKGLDGIAHSGFRRPSGRIGWLGHLNGYEQPGAVYFRNLRVKSLP